ncbi:hypothetical protein GCM10010306_007060 [Streptomyces umbrinus]|nr:hypothetical protein GCM10010306_007060 [Streptomyces umbrinus]
MLSRAQLRFHVLLSAADAGAAASIVTLIAAAAIATPYFTRVGDIVMGSPRFAWTVRALAPASSVTSVRGFRPTGYL